MSAKRADMHRLQELVRLHRMGTGSRERARLLGMGRNQERRYRAALADAGLLDGAPGELPALEDLRSAVLSHLPVKQGSQELSSVSTWTEVIEKKLRKGAGPKAIYDFLRLEKEDFDGSLWAVKRLCARLERERPVQPQDVAIPVETAPGQVAQVDFGYVGKLYDPEAGLLRKAWVFVMVLGHSRHQFCRVVFDQRVETWIRVHVEAFAKFGGVVDTVVPDNLKSAVIRAAFGLGDNPALNRSYRELARHYGFKVDPTPPLDPAKKGKVESGVKYVKRNFFKPRDLADIDEANREIDRWVERIAGDRIHGTTGRRPLEVFEQEERQTLTALPTARYLPVMWKKARVHSDSHFLFERHIYPVSWRFVGKEVWLRATPTTVEVYCDDTRIATHERGKKVPPEIVDTYLPQPRAALRHRGREYWLERADAMGEEVGSYIREVFDADDVLSMLRVVQAIVTLLEKHPASRACKACSRASYYGNYSYAGVRDILRKGLDLQPLPLAVPPVHGRLDNPRFARNPRELLQLPLERNDEPN